MSDIIWCAFVHLPSSSKRSWDRMNDFISLISSSLEVEWFLDPNLSESFERLK